jgi:hypothetical protein
MRVVRFFLVGTLALSLAASCSDDTVSPKDTGAKDTGAKDTGVKDTSKGPDASGIVTRGASLALSCVDVAPCTTIETTQGTVAATQLDICTYNDTAKKLVVKFVGAPNEGHIAVDIAPFTGDSTYQTTADEKINVTVAVKGDVPSNATASGPPEQKCRIIAKSNLAKIQIPSSGDANTLDLTLDVTCPKLEAGGVCNVECTPTPSNFQLSVKGCTVSK